MTPHRIRLRRPWRQETTAHRVVWRRWFRWPSRLGSEEAVWLCVEGSCAEGSVALNGDFLGSLPTPGPDARYDVTRHLLDRNELTILVEKSHGIEDDAAPPAEVSLEICSPENPTVPRNGDEP